MSGPSPIPSALASSHGSIRPVKRDSGVVGAEHGRGLRGGQVAGQVVDEPAVAVAENHQVVGMGARHGADAVVVRLPIQHPAVGQRAAVWRLPSVLTPPGTALWPAGGRLRSSRCTRRWPPGCRRRIRPCYPRSGPPGQFPGNQVGADSSQRRYAPEYCDQETTSAGVCAGRPPWRERV